ncbi:MAG: ATP-binding protein [Anaerolineales bacterium]|nr:ATP-binding protein [Anaerolineales bacterium]
MNIPSDKFYLGKQFDLKTSKLSDQPVFYDPSDLTTHGVIVGMTGSGKTGLGIGFLEEAALNGIPALIIDPKGDLTNLLLHFPGLAASDFEPWVDAEAAKREGKTAGQAAADAAASWKKGLDEWGIAPQRMEALQKSVKYSIYTPGSESGLPVSILASLEAPDVPWEANREVLREKIAGTVTAILGLVGFDDIDPLRSREHILLSNLLENAWSRGQSLDLEGLILQTQNPPIAKLGVFDVESFFPAKDRQALAMRLNSVLASPSFQTWVEGQPLDMEGLLYAPDGKPRHSVFYIAHLTDAERMFFVTLLLSAAEAWMRTRKGSSGLRALLYFDEVFGYLPPVANPPAKQVIIRMLKQARAFGFGLLLATQNPVDIDYKALSNAGTWCIGKLQTDQDKQRLLDGLETPGVNRAEYDKIISRLGKRVFLLHNTHAKGPVIFQTRWAMNYLAGPLTRAQIPALNKLVGAVLPKNAGGARKPSAAAAMAVAPSAVVSATRPGIPPGIAEFFLPQNRSLAQACQSAGRPAAAEAKSFYRPALLAQAKVRFLERKYGVDQQVAKTALVIAPDPRGVVRWQDYLSAAMDEASLHKTPVAGADFTALEPPLNDGKTLKGLAKDFQDWVYHESSLKVPAVSGRGAAGPQAAIDKKLDTLRQKLAREERELEQDKTEMPHRTIEEVGTAADTIFGMLTGRSRRLTTSLTKRRMTSKAAGEVEESKQAISQLKADIAALEQEKAGLVGEGRQAASGPAEVTLTPAKKDIYVEVFGVAWVPFYKLGDGTELIGYSA